MIRNIHRKILSNFSLIFFSKFETTVFPFRRQAHLKIISNHFSTCTKFPDVLEPDPELPEPELPDPVSPELVNGSSFKILQ